jgi:hypothetical protein
LQKLLGFAGEEVGQDLAYASSHLNLLSLCSFDNVTARKLYAELQIVFNDIREVLVSPVYRRMRDLRITINETAHIQPSHYDPVDGAEDVSKSILDSVRLVMNLLVEGPRL